MVLICKPVGRGNWNEVRIVLPKTIPSPVEIKAQGQRDLFKPRVDATFEFFGRTLRICEVHP